MRVVLVYAPAPRTVHEWELNLPEGCTVASALQQAHAQLQAVGGSAQAHWSLSVWGRKTQPDAVLREGDRLELLRPLRVDPKVARRERFGQQGSRGAGLFARRRPGAKPGY